MKRAYSIHSSYSLFESFSHAKATRFFSNRHLKSRYIQVQFDSSFCSNRKNTQNKISLSSFE